jgi:predicted nucleotidyltransferase
MLAIYIIRLMKTAAIITEYNPFHQGHAWQIQEIRRTAGEDCAIVVAMSGNFVQRGEPAIFDKWSRARAALACGVDLVIELPFAYAAASAERFAAGGVQLLQATGLDSLLVFGSECGDLAPLSQLAGLLSDEPPAYKALLHQFLDQGLSFPAARQQAAAAWTGQPELAGLLAGSNNILAVEYLKAIRRLPGCRLTPLTLQRQGQAYLDRESSGSAAGFASASAIRRQIANSLSGSVPNVAGLFQTLNGLLPIPSLAIALEKIQAGPGPLFLEDFAFPLLGLLRSRPIGELEQIPGMGEGLARRLAAAAARPGERTDPSSPIESAAGDNPMRTDGLSCRGRVATLLQDCATRRFPQTRIQRALIAMLAGLQADDLQLFDQAGGPQYLRILGFSRRGRHVLKIMRHQATRPILMKGSDVLEHHDPALVRMAELDALATDLWMLAAEQASGRAAFLGGCGRDFDTPVVMG